MMQDQIKRGLDVNAAMSYEHFYSSKYQKNPTFHRIKKKKITLKIYVNPGVLLASAHTWRHRFRCCIVDSRVSHDQSWVDIVPLVWGNILHRAAIFSISVWDVSGEQVQEFRSAMVLVSQRTRYERQFMGQSKYCPFQSMFLRPQRWKWPIILLASHVCVQTHTHTPK